MKCPHAQSLQANKIHEPSCPRMLLPAAGSRVPKLNLASPQGHLKRLSTWVPSAQTYLTSPEEKQLKDVHLYVPQDGCQWGKM